jgi:cold shock CspA family protein
MTGTIKRLVVEKYFGFVRGDGEQTDYFFHTSGCVTPFTELWEDRKVEFVIEASAKGPRATAIKALD